MAERERLPAGYLEGVITMRAYVATKAAIERAFEMKEGADEALQRVMDGSPELAQAVLETMQELRRRPAPPAEGDTGA